MELELNKEELKDLETFCSVNGLNTYEFIKKCYICGFNIEKYGLLGEENVKSVEIAELENKIKDLEDKLESSIKKRKMLEETILNLKAELSNFK